MRLNDKQLGIPETLYGDTYSNLVSGSFLKSTFFYDLTNDRIGYSNGSGYAWPISGYAPSDYISLWSGSSLTSGSYRFSGGGSACILTLPNNTITLTGSGTLSLGANYNFYITASGSAALINTSNTFTSVQNYTVSDTAYNNVTNLFNLDHEITTAGSVNMGVSQTFKLKSSTTANTIAGIIGVQWLSPVHASRAPVMVFDIVDSGSAREVLRLGSTGSVATIGFFTGSAVARASAYTQTYSTGSRTAANLTYTSPGAYVSGSMGYSSSALASGVLASLGQLNTDTITIYKVLTSVIDDLQAYGLLQ